MSTYNPIVQAVVKGRFSREFFYAHPDFVLWDKKDLKYGRRFKKL